MRKIFTGIAVLLTASILTTVQAAGSTGGMTIAQLQAHARERNLQTSVDNLNIKAKESAYKKAEEDKYKVGPGPSPTQAVANKVSIEVSPMEALAELNAAKLTKENNFTELDAKVYKTSMDILLALKEKEKEEQKKAILEDRLGMVKAKYVSDLVTENELHDAEYSLESKRTDLEKLDAKLAALDLELKKTINAPFEDDALIIKDSIKYSPAKLNAPAAYIESAKALDINCFKLGEAVKARETAMKWADEYMDEGYVEYDNYRFQLELANAQYQEAVRTLEANILNIYDELLSKTDAVELSEKYLALAEKKLETAAKKLEAGTISRDEYLGETEGRLEAEYQYSSAVHAYNLTYAEFVRLTGK